MPSQLYETLKTTALAHISAYSSPEPWDETAIWKLRAPGCVHYLHPAESLADPYNSPIGEEDHRHLLQYFGPIFERCTFDVKDLVIDVEEKIVVARMAAIFDFKAIGDDPPESGWKADYVWLTQMDKTGTKIIRVEEYMDQARLLTHVRGKAQKYAELAKSM